MSVWLAMPIVLLAACSDAAPPTRNQTAAPKAEASASFAEFWPGFRTAILKKDMPALLRMARPTIVIPAETEGDPPLRIAREKLPEILPQILAQDSQVSARERVSNAQFVERQASVGQFGPGVAVGKLAAQVGPFQFTFERGEWLLSGLVRLEYE